MLDIITRALRDGDAATALAAATRWSSAEPANPDALLWLGHAHAAGRDAAAAAAALDRALALAPQRADLLTARAYLDLQARELERATSGFDAALAQDPNQLLAYIALANLALLRGDRTEAERLVAFARRIDDGHPRLLVLEAQLAGGSAPDRVLPTLMRAAERAPADPLVQAALGFAFLERGNFAFAAQALRNAIARAESAVALRGALVVALESQGQHEAALAEAEAWRQHQPDAVLALWQVARLRARRGRGAEALEALDALLARAPRHADGLDLLLRLRGREGGPEALFAALEARIAADPGWPLPWLRLIALAAPQDTAALVARWREAAPTDPQATEAAALLAERQGRQGDALALAAEAIALEPRLFDARMLQARAAGFLEPEAAVARLDALIASAPEPAQRRALAGWRGIALHRAGRADEALAAWRQMWTDGPAYGLPLPNPMPAGVATPADDGGTGRLLWGPPGSRVERVHALLAAAAPERLLIDRWRHPMRDDGFNLLRVAPDDPLAGTAGRWRAPLAAAGMDPDTVIDALPTWDGWTQAVLHGTTLVVALRDPRDLLLNWMAWGSAAGFSYPGPDVASAWLCRVLDQVIEAKTTRTDRVVVLDTDRLDPDAPGFAAALAEACALPLAPDPTPALALGRLPGGQPADFPAGAWRLYAEPLRAAFAPLAERALRLGYPAD